ncbi:MAG: hypothetical protein ABJB66_09740 [Gemmatimonadaceae bacterium]
MKPTVGIGGDAFRTLNPAAACVAGMQAQEAGNSTKAIAYFERAVELAPSLIDLRLLLTFSLAADNQKTKAGTVLSETPEIETLPVADLRKLADTALQVGALVVALKVVRLIAQSSPDDADLQATLGALLHNTGALEDAAHVLQRAVLHWPKHVPTLVNCARLLVADGAYAAGLSHYDRALRLAPRNDLARWNRGMLRLMLGDHAAGWADCEARRSLAVHTVNVPASIPAWNGQNASGKTLLLWGEQGFGDQIQGVRFARTLAEMGAKVFVKCAPSLRKLFESVTGVTQVFCDGDAVPPCDAHVPMLSVPHLLKFKSDEHYASASYIHASVERTSLPAVATIGRRNSGDDFNTRVGLVWAGSPGHSNDAQRSLPISVLHALVRDVHVNWVSLQMGTRGNELSELKGLAAITNATPHLTDFVDTAHVLNALDRVVTVDTSVAHLAGAMGIPTLLLTPFVPDWRWQLVREDSPWYQSVRIIRQTSRGDWGGVVQRVHRELSAGGQARAA